jgi:hypothetical protein
MKKILMAAALILSTGILSSCSKTNDVQPVTQPHIMVINDKKNLATGD